MISDGNGRSSKEYLLYKCQMVVIEGSGDRVRLLDTTPILPLAFCYVILAYIFTFSVQNHVILSLPYTSLSSL